MNRMILTAAVLATLALAACDREPVVVNVPTPVAVPGPAGPTGATGATGNTGNGLCQPFRVALLASRATCTVQALAPEVMKEPMGREASSGLQITTIFRGMIIGQAIWPLISRLAKAPGYMQQIAA